MSSTAWAVVALRTGLDVQLAAERDVTGEDRLAAVEHADERRVAADVDERRHRIGALGVIHLVGVREGERLDVEDDRHLARLGDERGAILDAVSFRGDEEDVDGG